MSLARSSLHLMNAGKIIFPIERGKLNNFVCARQVKERPFGKCKLNLLFLTVCLDEKFLPCKVRYKKERYSIFRMLIQ